MHQNQRNQSNEHQLSNKIQIRRYDEFKKGIFDCHAHLLNYYSEFDENGIDAMLSEMLSHGVTSCAIGV